MGDIKSYKIFNIVRQAGDPVTGKLWDGRTVHKITEGYEWEHTPEGQRPMFFKCADYGNHFIYKVPKDVIGPSYCCSCGSMAVIIGSKDYSKNASPQGRLMVCKHHTDFNKHADGSQ